MRKSFLTRTIVILSLVSLCNDVASEMLLPVLPLYLDSIGFGVFWIGLIEGLAEAFSGLSKSYFGGISDRMGKRVPFIRWGYALSAISKPLVVLFQSAGWVLFMRMGDRLGKGLRTGARDAMLGDESTPENRGKVFGFHRSMDTVGAVLGPALALLWFMNMGNEHTDHLFWWAIIPGVASIALTFFLRDKKRNEHTKPQGPPPRFFHFFGYWKKATPEYKAVFRGLLVFFLFNSSDAFLLLMTKALGFPITTALGLYIVYNIAYVILAYPAGWLSDRIGMKRILLFGLLLFAGVYGIMGGLFLTSGIEHLRLPALVAAFILYGAYAACTDGVAKAWLSRTCHKSNLGEALGFYGGMQSLAALVASVTAGVIWGLDASGPGLTLLLSAAAAAFAIILLLRAPEKRTGE
jgi:MFS family permease